MNKIARKEYEKLWSIIAKITATTNLEEEKNYLILNRKQFTTPIKCVKLKKNANSISRVYLFLLSIEAKKGV